jgi:hypothetical protein
MGQKQAKAGFSSRQAWVEPVFSVLRGNQNLNRFRRKGLAGVQVEFGLHVLSYNIGRLIAFLCARYLGVMVRIGMFMGQCVGYETKRVRIDRLKNIPDYQRLAVAI